MIQWFYWLWGAVGIYTGEVCAVPKISAISTILVGESEISTEIPIVSKITSEVQYSERDICR